MIKSFLSVMKSIFPPVIVLIALTVASLAARQPEGFIVFSQKASEYLELEEFTSFNRNNVLYTTIVRPDGVAHQVENLGIVGVIYYPSQTGLKPSEAEAIEALRRIQDLQQITKRPDLERKFAAGRSKWETALAMARRNPNNEGRQLQAGPTSPASGISLEVDGMEYQKVGLTAIVNETAIIRHADGIARIPFSLLSRSQIEALNRTSATVRIDPDLRARQEAIRLKKEAETRDAIASNAFPALFFLLNKPQ